MDKLYPAFMFSERLGGGQEHHIIDIASEYDVEPRYWQFGPSHLYVFKVPWNGQPSGNLDEPIYEALQKRRLSRFDLGYASDYEWGVYSQEVLYWPEPER